MHLSCKKTVTVIPKALTAACIRVLNQLNSIFEKVEAYDMENYSSEVRCHHDAISLSPFSKAHNAVMT